MYGGLLPLMGLNLALPSSSQNATYSESQRVASRLQPQPAAALAPVLVLHIISPGDHVSQAGDAQNSDSFSLEWACEQKKLHLVPHPSLWTDAMNQEEWDPSALSNAMPAENMLGTASMPSAAEEAQSNEGQQSDGKLHDVRSCVCLVW